MSQLVW